MQNLRAIDETESPVLSESRRRPWTSVWPWIAGTVLALLIGSWFVWLSAFLQRKFAEDDIRAACQRAMPETAERCFDTVVIQRGGVRR
jgi:hypothetical protein